MTEPKRKLLLAADLPIPAQNALKPSRLFPSGVKIQCSDYLLEKVSDNDNKGTVTFRVAGVFVEDNDPKPEQN